ncbi:MAG: extracellular solute-binding protein, partial [Coriobacteriia bacterium]|nr:extracellular solute-binding protein [Coriobacteriia bacterium]
GHDDNSSSLSAAGSVAEINIVLPGSVEEIAALSSSKDGKTVYALTGGYFPATSLFGEASDARTLLWATEDQGKTWESVYSLPAEFSDSNLNEEVIIFTGAVNANGDCIVAKGSYESFIEADLPTQLDAWVPPPLEFCFIGQDGGFFEIDHVFDLVDIPYISFVADNRALIFDSEQSFLFDITDGRLIKTNDTANDVGMSFAAAAVSEDVFVIVGSKGIQCYLGLTGEPCDTPPGLGTMFKEVYAGQPHNVSLYSSEEAMYCTDAKSIYEYTFESGQYKKLFSFTELMLGGGATFFFAFAVDGDKTPYLAYPSLNQESVYVSLSAYVFEPNHTEGKSISIYTLEPNVMLNSAILNFQNANPQVKWTVEVGVDGVNALSIEDAIKQLSLRLLAGEGPDIILLDGLPVDSFIEKQVLADISSVFESKADINETFFSNIVTTYARDEKLYALPTSFIFYGAQGSQSFIEQASSVESLTSQLVKEAEAGLFSRYENEYGVGDFALSKYSCTIISLYSLFSTALVNDGRVDLTLLESYFSSCMALQATMGEAIDKSSLEGEPTSILFQAIDSISGSSQNGIGTVSCAIDLSALLQQQRNAQVAWAPIPTTGACFEPLMTIGVNTSSSYKNEAEAFLCYLLSDAFQETLFMESFPVNKEAFINVLSECHTDCDGHLHTVAGEYLFEFQFPEEDRSVYILYPEEESEIMACVDLMETLSVPITQDAALRSIVLDGLVDYLNGSMTLDKALSQVQNRVNLYLAE